MLNELKSETREISGLNFTVQQFHVFEGSVLGGRLFKLLGPAFGEMMTAGMAGDAAPIIHMLCDRVEPDELPGLFIEILRKTSVELEAPTGKKAKPTLLNSKEAMVATFKGDITSMFKVLAFSLEVNFQDFFASVATWIAAGLKRAAGIQASQSTSQTASATSQDAP